MDVRLNALKQAAASLAYLASVDLDGLAVQLDARLIDGLRNGLAQKFEYTFELCWKCIKDFIKQSEGIDEASPKKVIKALHLAGYINEDDYLALLKASDDRNRLSHIYDDVTFLGILARIPAYSRTIERVIQIIDHEGA